MSRPSSSVLPDELRDAIADFGEALERGRGDPASLDRVRAGLAALPPAEVTRAGREIANLVRLYHHPQPKGFRFPFSRHESEVDALRRLPGLEDLFVFHHDGHLREAALDRIHDGLPSALAFTAVASRLNDWVPEVRAAARRCAERVFPKTGADVVTAAAVVLLDRRNTWRRWTHERGPLDEALARADVVERLAMLIHDQTRGRMCGLLRLALRDGGMERYLLELSRSAAQPPVRALALRCLVEGRARWVVGVRKEWIDRGYGTWKPVPLFEERPIARPVSVESLIAAGLSDRSAMVRKTAAEGVVVHRATLAAVEELLPRLLADRNAAVRECGEFIVRERAATPKP
jgi:hypothetical protein